MIAPGGSDGGGAMGHRFELPRRYDVEELRQRRRPAVYTQARLDADPRTGELGRTWHRALATFTAFIGDLEELGEQLTVAEGAAAEATRALMADLEDLELQAWLLVGKDRAAPEYLRLFPTPLQRHEQRQPWLLVDRSSAVLSVIRELPSDHPLRLRALSHARLLDAASPHAADVKRGFDQLTAAERELDRFLVEWEAVKESVRTELAALFPGDPDKGAGYFPSSDQLRSKLAR